MGELDGIQISITPPNLNPNPSHELETSKYLVEDNMGRELVLSYIELALS